LFQDENWKEVLYNLSEKRGFLGMNGMNLEELFLALPDPSPAVKGEGLSFIFNRDKNINCESNEQPSINMVNPRQREKKKF
jgi:hypothetical protein